MSWWLQVADSLFRAVLNSIGTALGTFLAFKYGIDHLPTIKRKFGKYFKKSVKSKKRS